MQLGQPIQTMIIYVYWKTGSGKTALSVMLACWYCRQRIYSNVAILHKWKQVSKDIKGVKDLQRIQFSPYPWVALIDEVGLNISSRNFMTDENKRQTEIPILSRKKHLNLIYIAQLERMGDVIIREMSSYHIEMHSYWYDKGRLRFNAKILYPSGEVKNVKDCDMFSFMERYDIEYNTLDESKLKVDNKIDKKVDKKKDTKKQKTNNKKKKGVKKIDIV